MMKAAEQSLVKINPSGSESLPKINICGELTWNEYSVLFNYSVRHNLDSMFDGVRKLIREEGVKQLESNGN